MRSNQKNNRSRGRGNNSNRNKNSNPLTRSYDSNGPDVRVRGNASTVAEKYMQLARDARSAGDSVAAENYLQHAEHYLRIISAAQAQQAAQQQAQQQAQAARAEQHGQRQEKRSEKDAEKSADIATNPEAQVGENAGVQGEGAPTTDKSDRPKQTRNNRPRRQPLPEKSADVSESSSESGKDPASAPQPEVSELPAFVTADSDSSVAE